MLKCLHFKEKRERKEEGGGGRQGEKETSTGFPLLPASVFKG